MPVADRWRKRPFTVRKLEQLWRLVRESHEHPIAGLPRLPELMHHGETAVTFIGHSSFFLQIASKTVLIDPVFATRLIVLRRQRRPGLRICDLPAIDAVLVTHAHMDHLNRPSLRAIARATRRLRGHAPAIVVPNGVEDLVEDLGFSRVETMNWWQQRTVEGLRLTMTPAGHWGARMFKDTHREFGGYTIQSEQGGTTVYHSGDTAWFAGFREIGARLKPDLALLPIGAYFPDSYRGVHTSPEEAVRAFLDTGARFMVPMHYGTFRLGREPMHEPLQRLAAEAARLRIEHRVRVVAEGETLRISPSEESVMESRQTVGASKSV